MRHADRLDRREAGADGLAAARVAGHQVRLDQPGGDAQVRLQPAPVEQDGDAVAAPAEVDVRVAVARVVLLDPQPPRQRGRQDLVQLGRGGGAVQAGRDQDRDRGLRQPGLRQRLQDRRQEQRVRHRARRVRDRDHRVATPARQLQQRRAADRRRQRRPHRGLRLSQRRHRRLLQHGCLRTVGEIAGDLGASVGERDAHAETVSPAHAPRQSLWYRASAGGKGSCAPSGS